MATSSFGNSYQGNVTPQIDPPQTGHGSEVDRLGVSALAPKGGPVSHPHWRNDPTMAKRMNSYAYQGDIHSRLDDISNIGAVHTGIGPA